MIETEPVTWHNAIVGYDPAYPVDQLLAHPRNPKIHPTAQTEAVKAIIARVGWLDAVKVNVRTQHVLDGHDRIKAAMQAGQPTVPVLFVDVPEADEGLVLGSFDYVGALAGTDPAVYDELLAALQDEDARLLASLHDQDAAALSLPPAVQFKEYDESTADDVKYSTCPACGHRFPA